MRDPVLSFDPLIHICRPSQYPYLSEILGRSVPYRRQLSPDLSVLHSAKESVGVGSKDGLQGSSSSPPSPSPAVSSTFHSPVPSAAGRLSPFSSPLWFSQFDSQQAFSPVVPDTGDCPGLPLPLADDASDVAYPESELQSQFTDDQPIRRRRQPVQRRIPVSPDHSSSSPCRLSSPQVVAPVTPIEAPVVGEAHTGSQARRWVFTINNPTELDRAAMLALVADPQVVYLIVADEVGEEGTPHLQCYIVLSRPWRFTRIQAAVGGRSHLFMAKGTSKQASEYCKKDGNYVEHGECPNDCRIESDQLIEKWERSKRLAKEGRFDEIPTDMYIRYKNAWHAVFDEACKKEECISELDHLWIVGKTGIGKSKFCWTNFPGHYRKPCNKWWDFYTTQEVVVIEDVDLLFRHWLPYHLKNWSDHYPFIAERKGGSRYIRPSKIVVTSNYDMEHMFGDKPQDLGPLRRRFTEMTIDENRQLIPWVRPADYNPTNMTVGDNGDLVPDARFEEGAAGNRYRPRRRTY